MFSWAETTAALRDGLFRRAVLVGGRSSEEFPEIEELLDVPPHHASLITRHTLAIEGIEILLN